MKYKILMLMNYKVILVSFKEWYGTKGVTNRINLLNKKLYTLK